MKEAPRTMAIFDFDPPLNHHYVPYVAYEGLFLPHELKRFDRLWRAGEQRRATLSGENPYDDELRRSSVVFLNDEEGSRWVFEKLSMVARQCNLERFGFDLTGFQQELQLAEYVEGQFFDWHMDFGAGEISHRKLSLTVQLSEPDEYQGGSLQFMINQNIEDAPRTRGTVILFPSFLMHRVTRVEGGVRRSLVGWISGPPYR